MKLRNEEKKKINSIHSALKTISRYRTSWYHRDRRALLMFLCSSSERAVWPYWNKDYWFLLLLLSRLYHFMCSAMIIIIFLELDLMHCDDATDIYILSLFFPPTKGRFIFIKQWTHYNIFYIVRPSHRSFFRAGQKILLEFDGITFFLLL